MAASRHSLDGAKGPVAGQALADELAKALPKDVKFQAHHLSTPPEVTDALCHPPAHSAAAIGGNDSERRAQKPFKTYCEKHFLALSVEDPASSRQVAVVALEIYVYTTAFSTTIFVAKADSTGYLNLLDLPQGTPSPIRQATVAFVSFLLAHRKRKGKQCVVNLFARSQSQYLFPGSADNSGKHILDDRGLVKWWCRVLNPLLEDPDIANQGWERVHGYLVVPGQDEYETRTFLPRTTNVADNWTLSDPLEHISPYTADRQSCGANIPPRCLIPMYPDDPKARFVDELEEATSQRQKTLRGWSSPKTLAEFWDMMSYRQECSSGRLTGFMWLVFDPPASTSLAPIPTDSSTAASEGPSQDQPKPPPACRASRASRPGPTEERPQRRKRRVLSGIIIPRQPRVKTHRRQNFPKLNETPHYYWPELGRGVVVLDDSDYSRAVEVLLHTEFASLEQAAQSTEKWLKQVNLGEAWSVDVVGRLQNPEPAAMPTTGAANDLSGVVKRKRSTEGAGAPTTAIPINTLGAGLVRKKPKTSDSSTADTAALAATAEAPVNVLGAGLVRKKAKD